MTTYRLQRGPCLRVEQWSWGLEKATDNLCPARQAGDGPVSLLMSPVARRPEVGGVNRWLYCGTLKKKKNPAKHVLCVQGELPNSCPWNNVSGLSITKRLNLENEGGRMKSGKE